MPVVAVVVGILQLVGLLLLMGTLEEQPQLLLGNRAAQPLALGLASLTVFGAPIFAYGAARRMLALLLVANIGQLVLGLVLLTPASVRSTLLGAPAHALAVALMTLGAGMLEARVPGRRETAPLLRERPLAAAGRIAGVLVLAGMPPFGGWTAKAARLYAGLQG